MGRPRTIHVDRDALLLTLCRRWWAALEALDAPIADAQRHSDDAAAKAAAAAKAMDAARASGSWSLADIERNRTAARDARESREQLAYCERQRVALLESGLAYDLLSLTGRHDLSDSERLRTNQALRAMEAAGLVEIEGRKATAIWPTLDGMARARELAAKQEAPAGA